MANQIALLNSLVRCDFLFPGEHSRYFQLTTQKAVDFFNENLLSNQSWHIVDEVPPVIISFTDELE